MNKYRQAKTIEDYWEQRVVKHAGYYDYDCWQFMTKGDKNGYPQVQSSTHCRDLGLTRGHQLSYYLHKGPIPEDKIVCHTCDHPWCVNPDHLFLGTWDDNVQDMMSKGRYVHPTTRGYHQKLTPQQRQEILALKGKLPCTEVGPMYGVSFSNVAYLWRKYAT